MRRLLLTIVAGTLVLVAVAAVRAFRGGTQPVDAALRKLERAHPYFLGKRFESLPLSRIERRGALYVFVYGDCRPRCVQMQQQPLADHNPVVYLRKRRTLPCTRTTVRGVPAARFEGLEVYTGDLTVSLFARTADEELRMAAALRRVGEATPQRLPPPAESVSPGIGQCWGPFRSVRGS